TSYRVQVTPSINLMPDLQYLIDPANNPELDSTWIAGLRCILTL
ncbi:MAG: porin, partial [Deltaproteobacteria bacterium]